jgi:hypothetical protein
MAIATTEKWSSSFGLENLTYALAYKCSRNVCQMNKWLNRPMNECMNGWR